MTRFDIRTVTGENVIVEGNAAEVGYDNDFAFVYDGTGKIKAMLPTRQLSILVRRDVLEAGEWK